MNPQVRRASRRLIERVKQQGVDSLAVITPGQTVIVTEEDARPTVHARRGAGGGTTTIRWICGSTKWWMPAFDARESRTKLEW